MHRSLSTRRAMGVGTVTLLAASALVTVSGSAIAAPGPTGTATPALGTNAGGNVVSIAGTGFRDPITGRVDVELPKVVVGATPLCTSSTGSTDITTWSAVSATRITATMPAGVVPQAAASVKAVICFKTRGASAWTSVPYTYAKPVTPPDTGDDIKLFLPASGPMSGGQTVTLLAKPDAKTGTTVSTAYGVFQPNSTVFVGTVPATAVKAAGSSLSFVTPVSSAQGPQTITVRTPGFPDYRITPTTLNAGGGYKLTRAISISPSSGPTSEDTSILVKGAGFLSDTYKDHDNNPATPDKSLHVYLSDGQQWKPGVDPAADPAVAVPPVLCGNLQIVSDTELTCDVPKASAAEIAAGATAKPFTVIVTDNSWTGTPTEAVDDGDAIVPGSAHNPAADSAVSRSAIFVRADF